MVGAGGAPAGDLIMRSACIFALLLCLAAEGVRAQQGDVGQPALTVSSTLVQVPVLVKTRGGQVIFKLTANDFHLTDNGVPQDLTLDRDTDSQPLVLAIVVETGGAGARHLNDYRQLDAILDAFVGGVEHRVAVISFDSTPHLLGPFTPDTANASRQLATLREGDPGGAILDGVAFGVAQLRAQPSRYRRAILLLSETVDQGSKTTLSEALRLISDTNTTIYSFGFSSTTSAVSHEASKLNSSEGPRARLLQPRWSRCRVRRPLRQASARLHQPACSAPPAGHHGFSCRTQRAADQHHRINRTAHGRRVLSLSRCQGPESGSHRIFQRRSELLCTEFPPYVSCARTPRTPSEDRGSSQVGDQVPK
ncbi:hypothetical protein SBA3_4260012 [Candidatus Sulfopaludibacter sp. SbA3]|nr:hypothetical protein SBA3_4260012 [Candidatus Sulfopaludibacter sp. SbA3]